MSASECLASPGQMRHQAREAHRDRLRSRFAGKDGEALIDELQLELLEMATGAIFNLGGREAQTLAPGLTHDFHIGVVARDFHGRFETGAGLEWPDRKPGGLAVVADRGLRGWLRGLAFSPRLKPERPECPVISLLIREFRRRMVCLFAYYCAPYRGQSNCMICFAPP